MPWRSPRSPPPRRAPPTALDTSLIRQTASRGRTAITRTSGSAIRAQPSSRATITGTYQRRRRSATVVRPGGHSRSMTSQVSITGTAVPMCPTEKIITKMPTPGWGASMMASASAIRATAGQPRALPFASSMPTATTRV